MGNKVSRRHAIVDERYTRPQGLYLQRDFNQKKLRRLIRDAKLAPCYPGVEEPATNLDECPICFLFYPSLNRSKCCMKGICTECFLQMKSPTPARPPQCPFCKTANYAVEYRGARTLEEKGLEQMEEQKVIEAQIRMRQKELQEEEHRMQRRDEDPREDGICVSSDMVLNEGHGLEGTEVGVSGGLYAGNHMDNNSQSHTLPPPSLLLGSSSTRACVGSSGSSISRSNREVFDLDLEDIMVMEAIWLSIQERDVSSDSHIVRAGATDTFLSVTNTSCDHDSEADDNSVTGGLAGAITTSAKKQSVNNGSNSSETLKGSHSETDSQFPSSYIHVNREGGASKERICDKSPYYCDVQLWMDNQGLDNDNDDDSEDNQELNNWIEISLETGRTVSPCRCEDISEVGTSFSSRVWEAPEILTVSDSSEEGAHNFEEQMVLAMALSLAQSQTQSRYG